MSADKFFDQIAILRCPVCGTAFSQCGASLRCQNGHTFDPSAKGYVNFVPNAAPSRYSRELFEARRKVLENGFYRHVIDTVKSYMPDANSLLDAGCGDGTFTKALQKQTTLGVDLNKEAIRLAARGGGPVLWIVGDLTRLPITDASVDVVLNLLSPANYTEFARVLRPSGTLLKLVPQQGYLREIRALMGDRLHKEAYSNDAVVAHLSERFRLKDRVRITDTYPLTKEQAQDFIRMTPLTFNTNPDELDADALKEITIDVELLVANV